MSRPRRRDRRTEPVITPRTPSPDPLPGLEMANSIEYSAQPGPEEGEGELSPEQQAWEAFREEYYEAVEQLPLSLHRSFALMRELDDQAQVFSAQLLPAIHAYASLRQSLLSEPSTIDQLSTRTELSQIATLCTEIIRTSEEKVGLATAAYDSVDRHVRALDAVIKEQETSIVLGLRSGTRPVPLVGVGDGTETIDLLAQADDGEVTIGIGAEGAIGKPKGRKRDREREAKRQRKLEAERRLQALQTATETASGGVTPARFDMPIDPHEPRYCFCNQVSFGEMIACENTDCPREWFHLPCVGLQVAPRGKWLCSACQATAPKRERRR